MDKKNEYIHIPILLEESFNLLNITSSMYHIDATLGLGGHAKYFLSKNENLQLKGFDQDPFARKIARNNLKDFENRIDIISSNFSNIYSQKDFKPTSILFDIGISSLQIDDESRGFSFRFDSPLDMRMNPDTNLTAEIIINEWSATDLCNLFTDYGEEKKAFLIANKIVEQRTLKPFKTTKDLSLFIEKIKFKKNKFKNAGGNPSTLIFQALRIKVNDELNVLKKALYDAIKILQKGGRLGVITFHSLEDRIVKNCFNDFINKEKVNKYSQKSNLVNNKYCLKKITNKPILPSEEEILKNPRSRSSKLRVVEKIL
jgi:16S rRNA (cytosine1402-N4)-methyltransferase